MFIIINLIMINFILFYFIQVSQVQKGNEKKKKDEEADGKIPEPEQEGSAANPTAKDTGKK